MSQNLILFTFKMTSKHPVVILCAFLLLNKLVLGNLEVHVFDGNKYYWTPTNEKFTSHEKACQKEGRELVMIRSAEENSFLLPLVKTGNCAFIGASCNKTHRKGQWKWNDGSALLFHNLTHGNLSCDDSKLHLMIDTSEGRKHWAPIHSKKQTCGSICVNSFQTLHQAVQDQQEKTANKLKDMTVFLRLQFRSIKRLLQGLPDDHAGDDDYNLTETKETFQLNVLKMLEDEMGELQYHRKMIIGLLVTIALVVVAVTIAIIFLMHLGRQDLLINDDYPSGRSTRSTYAMNIESIYSDPDPKQNDYFEARDTLPNGNMLGSFGHTQPSQTDSAPQYSNLGSQRFRFMSTT